MTTIYDGVTEKMIDGVAVQRVDPAMLEGADGSSFAWCNTDNHRETKTWLQWQREGIEDQKYRSIMQETRMAKWQPVLEDLMRPPVAILTISPHQQRKYFEPCRKMAMGGLVSARSHYQDEAQELAAELNETYGEALTNHTPGRGWFVRTSACSPKDAQNDGGAGPHKSIEDVLYALFASERVHISMGNSYEKDATVYLFPFDHSVSVERELRVFVHQRQVTAMSQYDVFGTSDVFAPMDDIQLAQVARLVDDFHRNEVVPRWKGIENYIMDVEYLQEGESPSIRLIELNSFGAEMAASSALFHWVRDGDELYTSYRLCIRIRGEEKKEIIHDDDGTNNF